MHLNSYNGLNTPQFSAQKANMVNEKQMFWLLLLVFFLFPLINEREHNEIMINTPLILYGIIMLICVHSCLQSLSGKVYLCDH